MKMFLSTFWLIALLAFGMLSAGGRSIRAAGGMTPQPALSISDQIQKPGGDLLASPAKSLSQPQLLLQSTASAPSPNINFDCMSITDLRTFGLVTSILQDRRGFLWFGTRYGLHRYDGVQSQVYTFDSGEDPLNDNYVRGLYEDRAGNLWISTYSDLVRRDGATGEFTHYKHNPLDSHSLGEGPITAIGEDRQGSLWVGTSRSFNRFEPSTGSFTRIIQGVATHSAFFDRQGGFWRGTESGLFFDTLGQPGSRGTEIYRKEASNPESLSSNEVTTIYEDRQGILWLGTQGDGLNRLDPETGKVTRYLHDPADPNSLSNNNILTILEDSFDRLWVGTYDGLNLLDRPTGRFFHYQFVQGNPHSLNNDIAISLYQDASGVIWIGTAAGMCKINELASHFTHYQQGTGQLDLQAGTQSRSFPVLSDNHITAIIQDQNGILWIGTGFGGMNRLDRNNGSITVYQNDPADPASLPGGEITDIYEDRAGILWVGTGNGLAYFDVEKETFNGENALRDVTVLDITEDRQGNLLVGSAAGIWIKETGSSNFTIIPTSEISLAEEVIVEMFSGQDGAIWVSTMHNGLFRLEPPAKDSEKSWEIVHFPRQSGNPLSPGESTVVSFYEDSQNGLWMGSIGNGLVRFNQETQAFVQYLPGIESSAFVGCILGDAQGFLWLGTEFGLARFDPRRQAFAHFDARDYPEIGSGMTSCFQNKQGEMFFGGLKGLTSFVPEEINLNTVPPNVVINSLSLNNKPLRSDLMPDEAIQLSYKENNLSFDFVALDYTAPARNQYAYKMEGLDSAWTEAGTRRHAVYPDLKPGSYTFRVKASNNSGVWNEQGAAVHITITPPFWQTWWFLGTLGLVVAGVVLGGLRLRVKGLETRSQDLENQVLERTGALEQKTRELEALLAENSRLSQQSQELAVLEERNRLARDLHDSITQSLYGVALSAEVAAKLLNSGEVEKTACNLQELKALALDALGEMRLMIYELRPSVFEQEGLVAALQARLDAVEGRVGLKTNLVLQGEIRLSPPLEAGLYRIAQESLNNVLKHAHAHHVTITLAQDNQSILMEIADDGVGFDPLQPREAGFLGLQSMQERADEMGIELQIHSQVGTGTKIILRRPLP